MQAATPAASGIGPVGPYQTVRLLGRGAMGAVYLALDADGSAVALKVMALPAEAGPADAARVRFAAEAEAARKLSHPDIVAVLAAGVDGQRSWLAMALAPGWPLERYTRPARLLPLPLVLDIMRRVALALAHAHAAGVLHRDVKPANVLVHLPSGSVKLGDFGVARLADADQTRTGVVPGSPSYMAPEQLAGARATPACDLYAVGVTLFQLLTARLPHEGTSMGAFLRDVANNPAPDPRTLRPDLPAAVATLVGRLLARQPADRPASATALAAELQTLAAALSPERQEPLDRPEPLEPPEAPDEPGAAASG